MNIKLRKTVLAGMRFTVSVLLGALSVADKHHALFYLAAPTLSAAAGRLCLSPTGVFIGQLFSLLNPTARPITPLLLGLWLLPFAYPANLRARRPLSPVMLGAGRLTSSCPLHRTQSVTL